MGQAGERAHFPQKAGAVAVHQVRVQHLDGHLTVEQGVERTVDLRAAALAEEGLQRVAALDGGADLH